MLNRLDFAKKFELVVQQEIKNYQDSLNGILQSIRDVNDSIKDIRKDSEKSHSSIHSAQSDYESRLIELEKKFDDKFAMVHRSISNLCLNSQTIEAIIDELREKHANLSIKFETLNYRLENTNNQIEKISSEIGTMSTVIEFQLNTTKAKVESELARTKAEMMTKPSDVELLQRELTQRIDVHAIDVAGLLRELRALRRDHQIAEKKFEAIFMDLEKLKNERVP